MNESFINGFLGGMLIGLGAVILFCFNGAIMGVSGITSQLLNKFSKDSGWRLAFILGLVLGGFLYQLRYPVVVTIDASLGVLIAAGLLVGFGTVTGSGCTSGHGICGIARLSKRSITATVVFMLMGIITVWIKSRVGM